MTFNNDENIKIISKTTMSSHLRLYQEPIIIKEVSPSHLHSAPKWPLTHLWLTASWSLHCMYTPPKHRDHLDRYKYLILRWLAISILWVVNPFKTGCYLLTTGSLTLTVKVLYITDVYFFQDVYLFFFLRVFNITLFLPLRQTDFSPFVVFLGLNAPNKLSYFNAWSW